MQWESSTNIQNLAHITRLKSDDNLPGGKPWSTKNVIALSWVSILMFWQRCARGMVKGNNTDDFLSNLECI